MVHGDGFIKFYNCFMEKGKNKLTPKEWYFYSLLAIRWSPFTNLCETTITTISNVQHVFKDKGRPTRDKANTWEQIKLLKDKGLIQLLDEDYTSKKKFDYDKSLRISFMDLGDGFEKINPDLYYLSDDIIELYFLCILQRFKNKGFSHTFDGLAELLSCGESTAQTTVKSLKKKKMISYEQGQKFRMESGQFSRRPNTYYLCREIDVDDEIKEEEITVEDMSNDIAAQLSDDVVKSRITIFGEITLKELLKKKEYSNWGKKVNKNGKEIGAKIVEDDIDLLLTLEELEVEEPFYKKYIGVVNSWIKNKDMDTADIEKWMNGYHVKMKKKREAWEEKKKLDQIVNAVVIDGDIVSLDKDNVDSVDWNQVERIYYFNVSRDKDDEDKEDVSYSQGEGEFSRLADQDGKATEEMKRMAIGEYKRIVKRGERLTTDHISEIRKKVKE